MTEYVSFSAEINSTTTEHLLALMSQKANEGVDHIYLMMSSPGGNVMNGLNIYNVLRAMPFKLTAHNVGNIDSIANAIFLAADERYACPHSTFMFHGVGFDVMGGQNVRLEQKNLQEKLNNILADERRIGNIMAERSNINTSEVADLFKEARTEDATFARDKGIVQDIIDVNIPKGSPVFSLVFNR